MRYEYKMMVAKPERRDNVGFHKGSSLLDYIFNENSIPRSKLLSYLTSSHEDGAAYLIVM